MLDSKILQATLDQLESEKMIPRERIIDAIEQALAAAYKKDYGKKGQMIRAKLDLNTGEVEFFQVKRVVDETNVRPALTEEEQEAIKAGTFTDPTPTPMTNEDGEELEVAPRFDAEKHMHIENARKIKADVALDEELVFPLESNEDFGRIAAQTAKQVIMQRIREAEKDAIFSEFDGHQGSIVTGTVQKMHHGSVIIDLGRVTAILPKEEQIPGEYYKTGQRIKGYLYQVESTHRGVSLKISRSHPRFIEALFALESPEIASGAVEIKFIAREAGSRSKIAVISYDDNVDPIGACVGQKGVRVITVTSELSGEKIDIIPYSEDMEEFIANALAPARVIDIELNEEEKTAHVHVAEDQLSLAIGKSGQNVRLAAKLTKWKIDIAGMAPTDDMLDEEDSFEDDGFVDLASLASSDDVEEAPQEDEAPEEAEIEEEAPESTEETEASQ